MPLRSAVTVAVWSPILTTTSALSTGMLVKLRQPRAPAGSTSGRCSARLSSTRPSTRTQVVVP
jgi:hypothetical protein